MNKKYISIILVAMLTVAASITAIAMWQDVVKVNTYVETGELDWEFLNGTLAYKDACGLQPGYGKYRGNDWNGFAGNGSAVQVDKDVGCTKAVFDDMDGDGDYEVLNVTLENVYPYYYTHIAFKVHNNGDIPIKIWRIIVSNGTHEFTYYTSSDAHGVEYDLNGDGKNDIRMWWGDNFGEQLHYCDSRDISFDLMVLQGASQNTTLVLTIYLEAIAWNEYYVP